MEVRRTTRTSCKPLLMAYTEATKLKKIAAEDYRVIYDSKNQITLYCGGGNKYGTESQRHRSSTIHRHPQGSTYETNDAPYSTDD